MKCILKKTLWGNISCIINTKTPSEKVAMTTDCFIFLGKAQTRAIPSLPYLTRKTMPPMAFAFIFLVSSFPKPYTQAKESLAHRTLLDGFDNGWGVTGWGQVGKEAITSAWVHSGLTQHCQLDLGLACGNGESRYQRPSVSLFERTLGTEPTSQIYEAGLDIL